MKLRIGNKLRDLRENRKMTQAEMADLLDVPESTYSRYERNETQLSYNKIVKFAEMLNVPVQELLPETVSITNNNSGQGGSVVFGNQNLYLGDSVVNQVLIREKEQLEEKIKNLEAKFAELLERLESS
ncbi:MAG: helix-turn-helix transcriptional regulator [Bernardetiaceae bacterium]